MKLRKEEMLANRELLRKKEQRRRTALELFIQTIEDDSVMMEVAELYPTWESLIGKTMKPKLIFQHGTNEFGDPQLYTVIGAEHTAATHWPPSTASLYKIVGFKNGHPIWTQPLPTEAYDKGDIVSYNGELWISTYDGKNVWAPGVHGWEKYKG